MFSCFEIEWESTEQLLFVVCFYICMHVIWKAEQWNFQVKCRFSWSADISLFQDLCTLFDLIHWHWQWQQDGLTEMTCVNATQRLLWTPHSDFCECHVTATYTTTSPVLKIIVQHWRCLCRCFHPAHDIVSRNGPAYRFCQLTCWRFHW